MGIELFDVQHLFAWDPKPPATQIQRYKINVRNVSKMLGSTPAWDEIGFEECVQGMNGSWGVGRWERCSATQFAFTGQSIQNCQLYCASIRSSEVTPSKMDNPGSADRSVASSSLVTINRQQLIEKSNVLLIVGCVFWFSRDGIFFSCCQRNLVGLGVTSYCHP